MCIQEEMCLKRNFEAAVDKIFLSVITWLFLAKGGRDMNPSALGVKFLHVYSLQNNLGDDLCLQ